VACDDAIGELLSKATHGHRVGESVGIRGEPASRSAASSPPHLAQPLAHALAQASVHPGHSLSPSGLCPRSGRLRPGHQNSRNLRSLPTKSRRCHRVTSAADKAGEGDRTPDIQLGNTRAHDQNPRESGRFRRTPRSLAHVLAQGRA
jgi:hypothetical protein